MAKTKLTLNELASLAESRSKAFAKFASTYVFTADGVVRPIGGTVPNYDVFAKHMCDLNDVFSDIREFIEASVQREFEIDGYDMKAAQYQKIMKRWEDEKCK